jgi:hypothetical protein
MSIVDTGRYFSETDIINMLEFIAYIPLSLKQRIPQIQIGLLHILTFTSNLKVRGG